jgi:hypothetical protein
MPRDNFNLHGPTQTITKTLNSNKVPAKNSMVITKWINVLSSDQRFTTNLPKDKNKGKTKPIAIQALSNKIYLGTDSPEGKTKQTITQNTSKKIDLRTASQTVDNSTDTDINLLPSIDQMTKITLPPCAEILGYNNNDLLPNIDQITKITLPPYLGYNNNDLLPSIDQITKITLPPYTEILGEHVDYIERSQGEYD